MPNGLSERMIEALEAVVTFGSIAQAARELGICRQSLQERLKHAKNRGWTPDKWHASKRGGSDFRIADPPQQDIDLDELLRRRRSTDSLQDAIDEDKKLIPIAFDTAEPIGILFFGDPHLDDPRTNFAALEADMKLVQQTDGLLCANVGDTTNNWIGRLAGKYDSQDITKRQAFKLAEWFITELGPWLLFSVGGNHDLWSGAADPLEWFHSQVPARLVANEARCELQFPGERSVKMAVHHAMKGNSIYNSTHAQNRAAKFHYHDYHLLVSGHTHCSGYAMEVEWSGLIHHLVQVASYKRRDDYAEKIGAMPKFISPSVLAVIDPQAETEAGLVQVFHDRERGALMLKALRAQRKRRAA